MDIDLVRNKLSGPSLKVLLKSKGISKYRLAKDLKISYRTLIAWQAGTAVPSDRLAEKVGRFLGLITDKQRLLELEKKHDELGKEIKRMRSKD